MRRFGLKTGVATLLLSTLLVVPVQAQLSPEQIQAFVDSGAVPSIEMFREYLGLPNDGHFPEEISWDALQHGIDEDWRIYARSASDSKGPNIQFLRALDIMAAAGVEPDDDLKVIIHTMDEMGSPVLPAAIEQYADRLAADMLIIFAGTVPTVQPGQQPAQPEREPTGRAFPRGDRDRDRGTQPAAASVRRDSRIVHRWQR